MEAVVRAGRRVRVGMRLAAAAVVCGLLGAATPAGALQVPPVGFDGDAATTERITGSPTEAAVAISQQSFLGATEPAPGANNPEHGTGPVHARYAVLSRDDTFADSLAAAPLTVDGPLLFSATAALAEATRAELRRVLRPRETVYLLGGEAALSLAVEAAVAAEGFNVHRLAGPSRVETSIVVADEVRALNGGEGFLVALARADGPADNPTAAWADAVGAGWYFAVTRDPIILNPTAELHPAVRDWIGARTIDFTYLLGGTAALSSAVEAAVPHPVRIAGSERAGTAVQLARQLWYQIAAGPRRFVLVDGYDVDGWAYGLAAAGLAARAGAPVLYVNRDLVPESTAGLLASCEGPLVDVVGVAVSDAAIAATEALDARPCDEGAERYAVLVAGSMEGDLRAAGAPGMDVYCEPAPEVRRGADMACTLDVHDGEDTLGYVIVRDDEGRFNYDFGPGIYRSGAELVASIGSGLLCRDLLEQGHPYFYAVVYWFAEGEPDRMDADGNGIPCETVYEPGDVDAFWTA